MSKLNLKTVLSTHKQSSQWITSSLIFKKLIFSIQYPINIVAIGVKREEISWHTLSCVAVYTHNIPYKCCELLTAVCISFVILVLKINKLKYSRLDEE